MLIKKEIFVSLIWSNFSYSIFSLNTNPWLCGGLKTNDIEMNGCRLKKSSWVLIHRKSVVSMSGNKSWISWCDLLLPSIKSFGQIYRLNLILFYFPHKNCLLFSSWVSQMIYWIEKQYHPFQISNLFFVGIVIFH